MKDLKNLNQLLNAKTTDEVSSELLAWGITFSRNNSDFALEVHKKLEQLFPGITQPRKKKTPRSTRFLTVNIDELKSFLVEKNYSQREFSGLIKREHESLNAVAVKISDILKKKTLTVTEEFAKRILDSSGINIQGEEISKREIEKMNK